MDNHNRMQVATSAGASSSCDGPTQPYSRHSEILYGARPSMWKNVALPPQPQPQARTPSGPMPRDAREKPLNGLGAAARQPTCGNGNGQHCLRLGHAQTASAPLACPTTVPPKTGEPHRHPPTQNTAGHPRRATCVRHRPRTGRATATDRPQPRMRHNPAKRRRTKYPMHA